MSHPCHAHVLGYRPERLGTLSCQSAFASLFPLQQIAGRKLVDFELARHHMVENQVRAGGVTDLNILSSMLRVPRELFLPADAQATAYTDNLQKLGAERFVLAPSSLAKLLRLAAIQKTDTVLDIGAGTGYSTAVIAGLALNVTSVEVDTDLVAAGAEALAGLEVENARLIAGDINTLPAGSFDVIIIEGRVDAIPEALLARLNDAGRLVAVLAVGAVPTAHVYVKNGAKVSSRQEYYLSLPPLDASPKAAEFVL
jgi:protein-L-isoaspartate(D-aspartate) O-methyltransferase